MRVDKLAQKVSGLTLNIPDVSERLVANVKKEIVSRTEDTREDLWKILSSFVPSDIELGKKNNKFAIAQDIAQRLVKKKGGDGLTWSERINWINTGDEFQQLLTLLAIPEDILHDKRTNHELLYDLKRSLKNIRQIGSWERVIASIEGRLPLRGFQSEEEAIEYLRAEILNMRRGSDVAKSGDALSSEEIEAALIPKNYKSNLVFKTVGQFIQKERARIDACMNLVLGASLQSGIKQRITDRVLKEKMNVWQSICIEVGASEDEFESFQEIAFSVLQGDKMTWEERCEWCAKPNDYRHLFRCLGVKDDEWRSGSWMQKKAALPKEKGGIGIPLNMLYQVIRKKFDSYKSFLEWMDGHQSLTNDEILVKKKLCITLMNYIDSNRGMSIVPLREAVRQKKLPIIGYRWRHARQIPLYEISALKDLEYVKSRLELVWLDAEERERVVDGKHCTSVGAFTLQNDGLNRETLKKYVDEKGIEVMGYTLTPRGRVPIYEVKELEKLTYVQDSRKYPELDNATAEVVIKGKLCIGPSRYVHIHPNLMRLPNAIEDAKLPIIGYAISSGKKVAVYEKAAVEKLDFYIKRKNLGKLDMNTGETIMAGKRCIGVARYAVIHRDNHIYGPQLQKAIDAHNIPIAGYSLVGNKKVVPVYEKKLVEELEYIQHHFHPEKYKENTAEGLISSFITKEEFISFFKKIGAKNQEWRTRNGIRDLENFRPIGNITRRGIIDAINKRFISWQLFVACMDGNFPFAGIQIESEAKKFLREEILRLRESGNWIVDSSISKRITQDEYDEIARPKYYKNNPVVRAVADFLQSKSK